VCKSQWLEEKRVQGQLLPLPLTFLFYLLHLFYLPGRRLQVPVPQQQQQ
jgi:hypothetical protein